MLNYTRVPLVFLFIGSILGVFLRWQFIVPTNGINYAYVLHAHSHIMFLGWIFNCLYIGFVQNHTLEKEDKFFKNLFVIQQILVVGMLISFPMQGYGFYSITFSTSHTLVAIAFMVKFFYKTKYIDSTSAWYARSALVFFLISTAGPFSLGYLMATGQGQSNWYYLAIYFYLHFQYNGFFLFGVLSLFFDLLERKKVFVKETTAKTIGWILAATCLPTYLLSTLWAKPGISFNIVGGLSALLQLIVLYMLIRLLSKNAIEIKKAFSKSSVYILLITLLAFALKLLLQLISALPDIAQMAYELRPIVIAYLHMVLIGIISLTLFVWYIEFNLLGNDSGKRVILLFIISFVGMEMCLALIPWWAKLFGSNFFQASKISFFFSAMLSVSCLLLLVSSLGKKLIKISS